MPALLCQERQSADIGAAEVSPLYTGATQFDGPDGETTLVSRIWSYADAAACRRCDDCTAARGPAGFDREGRPTRLMVCHVAVASLVDAESASRLSLAGP